MTEQDSSSTHSALLQHMAAINRLNLKAFNAISQKSLAFIILNETIQGIKYDRASLYEMQHRKPRLLGVSGQADQNKDSRLVKQWIQLVKAIKNPKEAQIITEEALYDEQELWTEYKKNVNASVVWLPILYQGRLLLGLWLEVFDSNPMPNTEDALKFLMAYLTPAYASAWKKFSPKYMDKTRHFIGKKQFLIASSLLLLFLLLFKVPLRIVAPCEVVASNPILITAPLEGIIKEIKVNPGDIVKEGDVLVEYDKRIPLRNLRIAQKEVEILEAEFTRSRTLGLDDKKSRTELGINQLKLQKEKVNLSLAKWQASQLTIRSPVFGIVMLDNPDAWRGKPVQVGEKILSVDDPTKTKLKIWIPEDDNVILNPDNLVKIYLNIDPEDSYYAILTYIANESSINDEHLPSFVAEAKWKEQPEGVKLGLKGTAILYGEKVSLFYYLIRKPWAKVRNFFGV